MARGVIALLFLLAVCISGKIHDFDIDEDDRESFYINSFAIGASGGADIKWAEFSFNAEAGGDRNNTEFGIIATKAQGTSHIINIQLAPGDSCLLHDVNPQDIVAILRPEQLVQGRAFSEIKIKDEGLYHFWFARCGSVKDVTFTMTLEEYNIVSGDEKNYLTLGEQVLPKIYLITTVAFLVLTNIWFYTMYQSRKEDVRMIHWLMVIVCIFKVLSVLFEAIRMNSIAANGVSLSLTVIYYFFYIVKTVMIMSVVLFIGFGYSILRGDLTCHVKLFLGIIVIPLIVDSVCLSVLSESTHQSRFYQQWLLAYHFFYWGACLVVSLFIWGSFMNFNACQFLTGKSEEETAAATKNANREEMQQEVIPEAGSPARPTMHMVQVSTICFIFFASSRTLSMAIKDSVSYEYAWLEVVCVEGVAFIVYLVMGLTFSPAKTSPYFALSQDEITPIQSMDDEEANEMM